jgi:hypothetical protein
MIKFLFDNCRDLPVVGGPVKGLYVGYLVKELIKKGKNSEAKSELKNLGKEELDNALKDQANQMWDENITPQISQYNIPDALVSPMKEKAIEELTGVLKEKVVKGAEKVEQKI